MKSIGLRSLSTEVPMPPTSSHPHIPLPSAKGSLIYTETDEAPALATYSLLPILSKVCNNFMFTKYLFLHWMQLLPEEDDRI